MTNTQTTNKIVATLNHRARAAHYADKRVAAFLPMADAQDFEGWQTAFDSEVKAIAIEARCTESVAHTALLNAVSDERFARTGPSPF